jgi:hypothetical protein
MNNRQGAYWQLAIAGKVHVPDNMVGRASNRPRLGLLVCAKLCQRDPKIVRLGDRQQLAPT